MNSTALTIRELKRGDVFRYTEVLDCVPGETETLHVVVRAAKDCEGSFGKWHSPAEVSALGSPGFLGCRMRVKPDLAVQKVHDSSEVERAARFLGLEVRDE